MDADKFKWDKFVLPKLKKLIFNEQNNGTCSPLSINVSEKHRGSNKILTDEEEEANMTLISNDSMRMTSTDSMTIHHHHPQASHVSNASLCERDSIPMPIPQIMSHDSASMAGKSVSVSPRSSQQTNGMHVLGTSVQMDISIDLK